MLKSIYLNQKKVPVPIPLKSLKEVIQWIEEHLLRPDQSITRIRVDHQDVEWLNSSQVLVLARELNDESIVECQIDSPTDISIQTLDALRNLCVIMERSLKPIAVKCWQTQPKDHPNELTTIQGDLDLIQELLEHLFLILDPKVESHNVRSFKDQLTQARIALDYAIQVSDWKASAKVMLKQLEPIICELNQELGSVQKCVFELIADQRFEARRQSSRSL